MKLYFSPGACSLAPHIALREAGLPHTLERVTMKTHQLADGTDFYSINALGYVPVLELNSGERLRECSVVLQYIADQVPDKQLANQMHLMGEPFTVADVYLFTVTNWSAFVGVDISGLARLSAFQERVAARPAVQAAMRAEGIIK